jgi:hypothetical protein
MKFTLEIELENDAMRTSTHLAKALRDVGERVRAAMPGVIRAADNGRIRDINGNTVGSWQVKP